MALAPKPTAKLTTALTDEELYALLNERKAAKVPTLKAEIADLEAQIKAKIAELRMYGESYSLVASNINVTDEDKSKVTGALTTADKALGKTELAKASGFMAKDGKAPSSKFNKLLKEMLAEGLVTVDDSKRPHMVSLAEASE